MNSFEFGSDAHPLANLNWEDIVKLDGGDDAFGTVNDLNLDRLDTPIGRIDHNQLPASQRLRSSRLKSAKRSFFHHPSTMSNFLDTNVKKFSPDSAKNKMRTPETGLVLLNRLKSRGSSPSNLMR